MVLKGLRFASLLSLWWFAINFQGMVLKGVSGAGVCLVSMAKTDFETFLHNTQMRPNLVLAGCPMNNFFWCLGLYNVKVMVLK